MRTALEIRHSPFVVAPADKRQLITDNSECYWNIIKSRPAYLITLITLIMFPLAPPASRFYQTHAVFLITLLITLITL
jgi:hypothetical protein